MGSPAYAHASGLADAKGCELVHGFVGKRAAARDHTHPAGHVNVAGHDSYLALAAWRNEARTVRADKAGRLAFKELRNAHHVHNRYALGYAGNEGDAGVGGLQDGVRGEGGGHEDQRNVGARLVHGLSYGVEYGGFLLPHSAAPAGGNAGH